MAEPRPVAKRWLMITIYLLFCMTVIFFHMLPLETTPRRFAGPDLIVAISFAWAIRRPDYLPVFLVATILLLTDLMYQRPPGLWAALVLAAVEFLKSRAVRQREATFPVEWINMAILLIGITIVNRLILITLLAGHGSLVLVFSQLAMTIAVYPAIVLLSHLVLGVRKRAPGDFDGLGSRI